MVFVHRCERFIVTIENNNKIHKIFQIIFHSNGSLFVNFPYYRQNNGLISLATLPANINKPMDISLASSGKVTSHLVKYSHHPDGNALFSQDGKVRSVIRKQSTKLEDHEGHLFTMQFQGIENFESANPKRDSDGIKNKRSVIKYHFTEIEPESYKIVGHWHSLKNLKKRSSSNVGPTAKLINPQGLEYYGFLLSPPLNTPFENYVLVLSCSNIPRLDKQAQTCLTFIGGFDIPTIAQDNNKATSFLALSYPAINYEQLKGKIGSIDFFNVNQNNKLL